MNVQQSEQEVELFLCPLDGALDKAWSLAYPLLNRVWEEDRGRLNVTLEEMYFGVLAGTRQLWICNTPDRFVAAMITQITPYRDSYSCDLNIYANEIGFRDVSFMWLPTIKDWAAKEGCKYMRAFGREGWKKVLKEHGFKMESITMYAEIEARTIN